MIEPALRDTAGVGPQTRIELQKLDRFVDFLLHDFTSHPLPSTFIHLGTDQFHLHDPLSFASFVVAHRAERLVQGVELGASALDCLEHGSLQLAAGAARMLLEISFVTVDGHAKLLDAWRPVHGSPEAVLEVAGATDTPLWAELWQARLGNHLYDELAGTARRDRVSRGNVEFAKNLDYMYAMLCEVVHPNAESQGAYWRAAPPLRDGRPRLSLEPTGSQSPVKLHIANAVHLAYQILVPYCRDLWWVAAETAMAAGFPRDDETISLGVPLPGRADESCCCGSGTVARSCDHPEPVLPISETEPARGDA